MKIAVIVVLATAAMCGEAVRFTLGAITAETFHLLLVLIVAAGCAIVLAFKKSDILVQDATPPPQRCDHAKAAALGK